MKKPIIAFVAAFALAYSGNAFAVPGPLIS